MILGPQNMRTHQSSTSMSGYQLQVLDIGASNPTLVKQYRHKYALVHEYTKYKAIQRHDDTSKLI